MAGHFARAHPNSSSSPVGSHSEFIQYSCDRRVKKSSQNRKLINAVQMSTSGTIYRGSTPLGDRKDDAQTQYEILKHYLQEGIPNEE
eukprot:1375041-Amorphochlora_amoeboformis.AAC.1